MEWQTAETAPKDGTEFLAWREDCGTMLVRWIAPAEFLHEAELVGLDEDDIHEEDWFYADFVSGGRVQNDGMFTLWTHLPTPPKDNADE